MGVEMGLGDRMGRLAAAGVSVLRRGRWPGRFRIPAVVILTALLAPLVAGCSAPDFGDFSNELKFGDETVSDTQVTDTMRIPPHKLGSLIKRDQIKWMMEEGKLIPNPASPTAPPQKIPLDRAGAIEELKNNPVMQCQALSHTSQSDSPSEGTWKLQGNACVKQRELSWLEKTLWSEYEKQSKDNFAWLTTSRNTLKANPATVSTLKNNSQVDYNNWSRAARPYLNVLLAFCIIVAVISLMCAGVRMAQRLDREDDSQIMDRLTWIFLGVFIASSAGGIVSTFFMPNGSDGSLHEASWTPGQGTTYYLSDWIRAQLDPIIIIAAVVGVMASGLTAAITTNGQSLIKVGKAFSYGLACNILLAGGITLFQDTIDSWTASMMKSASSMMNDAWNKNALNASQFFGLDGFLAVALVLLIWIMGMVMKIFTYLRAGMLPVLVALAGVFSVMSYSPAGDSSFKKCLGWLATFLAYKPAAALFMATGSAIMVTAGHGDDSATITVFLQIGVIAMLPLLVRWIVPAAQNMSSGGEGFLAGMASGAAGGAVSAGGATFRGMGGMIGRMFGRGHGSGGSRSRSTGSHEKPGTGGKGPGGSGGSGRHSQLPGGTGHNNTGGMDGNGPDGAGHNNTGGMDAKGPDGAGHNNTGGTFGNGTGGAGRPGGVDSNGGDRTGQGPDGAGHNNIGGTFGNGPDGAGQKDSPFTVGGRGSAPRGTRGSGSNAADPGVVGGSGPDGARRSSTRRGGKEF